MAVEILSDKEHVLRRPAMYIGSTVKEPHERFLNGKYQTIEYTPGLVKIISEIIDNSIDEAIRTNFEFANKIVVNISNTEVVVSDNGRGIPQSDVITPEGDTIPGPFAAWTRTKAGSNFGDDKDRKTIGMNGVGSSLTNFFSALFVGETCDGKNAITVTCSNNADNCSWTSKKSSKKGTKVYFIPDFSHFDCNEISPEVISIIQDQIQTLAVIYPEISFTFNGKQVNSAFRPYARMFSEDSIIFSNENISLMLCNSPDGFRQQSYVNGVHTKNGGSHIDFILEEISQELMPAIKKKYKIEIQKARIKECLTMVLFIKNMSNMRFDSQTKERLTSPWGEIKNHINLDAKKISRQILNSPIIEPIIEAALARKLAADKAAETRALKQVKKARIAKHIKANKSGDSSYNTTLHITEGDSAIGYLLATRNKDLHGGYPLRGKVLNTWGMTYGEMLKNKELFELCSITGLILGEKAENLQYENIAIMCDADVDGQGSITPAIIAFLSNWPELFEQGRVKIVKTPIVIAQKGTDEKWFYSLDEYEAVAESLSGYKTRYLKGLGSLEEYQYEKVINEPVYDVVKFDENWKELLEMLFGNDADKRKIWMME